MGRQAQGQARDTHLARSKLQISPYEKARKRTRQEARGGEERRRKTRPPLGAGRLVPRGHPLEPSSRLSID